MFKQHFRSSKSLKPESVCLCSDSYIAHWTPTRSCVAPGCGCTGFKSQNKHNARITPCGDHSHRSGLEARVCADLHILKKVGEITDIKREPRTKLYLDGVYITAIRPDFYVTYADGTHEYVEAKGQELGNWKRNWKILQKMHAGDPSIKFRVVK